MNKKDVEQQVRADHQDKLSDYAVSRIAEHRIAREKATAIINDNAPVFAVGDTVRETNFGHTGRIVEIKLVAHVVWYVVMFATATRDVFSDCLASHLERVPFGWDKV